MTSRPCLAALALVVTLPQPAAVGANSDRLTQHLRVSLDPRAHRLAIEATVTWPAGQAHDEFLLNAALTITRSDPPVDEVPLGDVRPFFGNNTGSGRLDASRVRRYRLRMPPRDGRLTLNYAGVIHMPLAAQGEEYARGFRETPGLITAEGVYLAGATYWYPHFGRQLLSFSLEVRAPDGWHLVSQGRGTSRGDDGLARWVCDDPMDEIYLVGGPLHVWRDQAGSAEALVYLRTPDEGLARKYLEATSQYLTMYRGLIGPYPYEKFALVENFWETGYGMPSFTLLGPSVIRFPFILTSSYPHEILHNWWGNGVFVDYETGNWSEGLTAYLADHLLQEQRGLGATYRRMTLQKYRDYVSTDRDFPLTAFRSRHSATTEAVGYGKMLMGTHMLRLTLGDDRFTQFLQRFYREQRGRIASFADWRATAEQVAGRSLATFFDDWIERDGAPTFAVEQVEVVRRDAGFVVTGHLVQTQAGPPYRFPVPLVAQMAAGPAVRVMVEVTSARTPFAIATPDAPLALHVDPEFDVFRRLDPRETPPTLSMLFGDRQMIAVLPGDAPEEAARYRELLKAWESPGQDLRIVADHELTALPPDRSVWLLGSRNRLAPAATRHEPRFAPAPDGWLVGRDTIPTQRHSAVVVVRHPANPARAVAWLRIDPPAAFPGVARKLPHYGRYSYLGFEGDEPVNTVKGEWATTDSPLRVDLRPADRRAEDLPPLVLPARRALVDLPPAFSSQRLREHVAWLAAPEREGRGLGTRGLDAAADYIVEQFRAIGLEPAGSDGYRQPFAVSPGPDGATVRTSNLVGLLRGTRAEWANAPVIVSAHYDHLGRGWPEARAGAAGQIHPGADDNASGVAVLIELARHLASGERLPRPVLFVAFSAEEAGLAGARHYVDHPVPFPLDQVLALVNLDTVGRLATGKVQVLGTASASEWPHIFRGASVVTGVESVSVPGNEEASDQRVFIERGVPAVQIFTGPHEDYHRPGDTAEKVDVDGLVKVATLVKEAVVYLAGRAEPLTPTMRRPEVSGAAGPAGPGSTTAPAPGGRRVTFGAVPDFSFTGSGVRLSGVVGGSPAEAAGLREGDILVAIDGRPVTSLAEFSAILRTLEAGQTITATFERDGVRQAVSLAVVTR